MKKARTVSLICCLFLLVVAMLFGTVTKGLSQKKLLIWVEKSYYPEYEQMFEQIVGKWEAKTGMQADITIIPSGPDLVTKVSTAIATGIGPDVSFIYLYQLPVVQDNLADVSDVALEAQDKLGPYGPLWEPTLTFDGIWRAIPVGDIPNVWNYRKDWHDEAGLTAPDTWHDALINAMKLNDPPRRYGMGLSLGRAHDSDVWWQGLWWGYGGKLVEKDGKTLAFDSPETRVALAWIVDAFKKWKVMPPGVLGWGDADNNTAFLTGKIAATTNAASIYFVSVKQNLPLAKQMGHSLIPAGPKGRFLWASHVRAWMIPKFTKNLELAKNFLRYYSTKEVQITMNTAAKGFYAPPQETVLKEIPLFKEPMYAPLAAAIKYDVWGGWPGPITVPAAEVEHRWLYQDMLAAAGSGKLTVEEAVKETAKRIRAIYAEYFPELYK